MFFQRVSWLKFSSCCIYIYLFLLPIYKIFHLHVVRTFADSDQCRYRKKGICPFDSGLINTKEKSHFHKLWRKCWYAGEMSLQLLMDFLGITHEEISHVIEKLPYTVENKNSVLHIPALLKLSPFPCWNNALHPQNPQFSQSHSVPKSKRLESAVSHTRLNLPLIQSDTPLTLPWVLSMHTPKQLKTTYFIK